MSSSEGTNTANNSSDQSGTNLWRLLEVIALRRRFILSLVMVSTVGAVIISLLLPKWYRAEALLLPPKDERVSFSSLNSDLSEWASVTGGLNLPVMVTPSDVFVSMLGSRAAKVSVIDSLDLIEHFGAKSMTDALMIITENSEFRVTPEGLIRVRYADQDPQMAAIVANAFVDKLNQISNTIFAARTLQSQDFVQSSLRDTHAELDSARAALRYFQESNHAIDLNKQTELAINSASALKAKLATLEVELTLKSRTLSETHPEVTELVGKVTAYKRKISELEYGSADSSYFSLPVAETPRLQAELAELTARVQVAERLYENLRVRLDEINIQAKRDAPTIPALDRATPPDIRFRPQRSLIVAGAFGFSLILAVLLALFFEHLIKLERVNPEDYKRARFFFDNILKLK